MRAADREENEPSPLAAWRAAERAKLATDRERTSGLFEAVLEAHDGLTIDVPSRFISGKVSGCVYWSLGALAKMRNEVCPRLLAVRGTGINRWVLR